MRYIKTIMIVSILFLFGVSNTLWADTTATSKTLSSRGVSIASLYLATFNRFPDADGLEYWEDSSLNINQISQSFFDQRETQLEYPKLDSTTLFIEKVYQNFLNRLPDSSGLAYWEGELSSNRIPRGEFIQAVITGAQSSDRVFIDERNSVMNYFLQSTLSHTKSEEILAEFDSNGKTSAIELIADLSDESARIAKFGSSVIEIVSYPAQTTESTVTVKITNDEIPQRVLIELKSGLGSHEYPITLTMTTSTGRVLYHYTDLVITVEKIALVDLEE